jgi:hypothetical protein
VFGGKYCGGCDCEELVIGHGQISPGEFTLGILEHVYILGDALRVGVVAHHLGREINELAGVESAAVCVEELQELLRGDMRVE